jgi:hypothetical protein
MIGRENVESDPFDVGSDDPFLTLGLPTEPIRLEGLRVTAVGRCAMGSELEPETALVWEEARKALRVASTILQNAFGNKPLSSLLMALCTSSLEADTPRCVYRSFAK